MAKEAKKVKTKAKINWGWDAPEDRSGRATRATAHKIKKIGFKAVLIILIVMIVGGAIGAGACYFVCRNDCFEIIGEDHIERVLKAEDKELANQNVYIDEGVKVISFGRDVSDKVYIETDLIKNDDGSYTATEPGTHYIVYKVDDIKYGKIFTIQRIRLIDFVESSEEIVVD